MGFKSGLLGATDREVWSRVFCVPEAPPSRELCVPAHCLAGTRKSLTALECQEKLCQQHVMIVLSVYFNPGLHKVNSSVAKSWYTNRSHNGLAEDCPRSKQAGGLHVFLTYLFTTYGQSFCALLGAATVTSVKKMRLPFQENSIAIAGDICCDAQTCRYWSVPALWIFSDISVSGPSW